MPKAIDIELIILLPNDRFGLIASFHEPTLMRCFSLPHRFLCLFCVIPRPPFLREAFEIRSGRAPSPMHHTHSPAPWFSPRRPHSPLFLHLFTDILSSFIQNRAYSEKSPPEVLPVSQKCVPLHSLSEREAQATSEWIFDRLRTANKTRQRWDVVSAKQEVNSR